MAYLRSLRNQFKYFTYQKMNFSQEITEPKFETVFSFPSIKYIAIINRLKMYHIFGTSIGIPGCGVLEMANAVPPTTFLSASYIGLTGAALLCLATLPFRNIIGFLYISEDNKYIKISSVNYWGKRVDKVIPADDWMPLLDMSSKPMDPIYLSPQLTDGSTYKLLVKFGNVLNAKKMGQVLE
ncbi:transmembrane protein 186 [Ostrinia nubilalis]|uniref:transmembrane protein 186 n=1 Tax=Ostrinia furnacalis TaxID=93504 RepID=UPI00103D63BE|nr:transmembrane protein 186 [Ostrinia furnacalis]